MSPLRLISWRGIISQSFVRSELEPERSKKSDSCALVDSREDHLGGEEKKREKIDDDNRAVGTIRPESAGSWGELLPELLGEIMNRVETSGDQWPQRQNVVACGGVCRQWNEAVREAVEKASLHQPGKITFTSSLKKPGPCDAPVQCIIRRNKENATFSLYLAQSQSFTENGKFLLAARRYRTGVHSEYIISLSADDVSPGSRSYVGKVRSNLLGTNFKIYDSQPPLTSAKASCRRPGRRIGSKQVSPHVAPARNVEVGHISYKFNLFKSRGPRRMECSLTPPSSGKKTKISDPQKAVLKNKLPRWHEHLECWCLNFHGRVTVASVKNFQLIAAEDPSVPGTKGDGETVLLQFGKVGRDTFTMDYRHPLSPFQAFGICLTTFGTKVACD